MGYIDLVFLGYNDQNLTYIENFLYYIEVRKKIVYYARHGQFGQHLLLPQLLDPEIPGNRDVWLYKTLTCALVVT